MAIANDQLINHYQSIHQQQKFGGGPNDLSLHIQICMLELKPQTVLEYGCGQSQMYKMLEHSDVEWVRYDPAIPELSKINIEKADMIVNTDVLEHIPADEMDDVLMHIRGFSAHVFFNISTRLAKTILPDGSNAHCTVWDAETWLEKIRNYFPDASVVCVRPGDSCTIVTWDSPVVEILSQVEKLVVAHKMSSTSFWKKLERKFRRLRNWIIRK